MSNKFGHRYTVRSLVVLSGVFAAVSVSGCTPKIPVIYSVTDIDPYLRSLTETHDFPLAREITWKYLHEGGGETWFAVDGKLIKSRKSISNVPFLMAEQATSGTKLSDVYAAKADDARFAGRIGEARMYSAKASTALEIESAFGRTAATTAFAQAMVNVGSGLVNSIVLARGANVALYVKDDMAVIGERAPPGSVLEVVMRTRFENYTKEVKPADTRSTWEAFATLKDGDGKIWKSNARLVTYAKFYKQSEPIVTPPELQDYMAIEVATFLPEGRQNEFTEEYKKLLVIGERQGVWLGGLVEMIVVSATAIDGLYEQIEFARSKR